MSVDAVSSIGAMPYVYPTHAAVGGMEDFAVDASALRTDAAAADAVAAAERPQANTFVDPADAAKFSRDFPQILMQQAFAPPVTETAPVEAARDTAGVGANALWQGDSARSGDETDLAVEEAAEDAAPGDEPDEAAAGDEEAEADQGVERNAQGEPMSEGEMRQVQELRNRDREVRTHEQAHQAAGGRYAGGASYEYQQGPDGQRYAVGGEVSIDVSPERDPEATIAKMRQVRAAALAPAEPSSQDRSVAASAQATEMEARSQLAAEQTEARVEESDPAAAGDGKETATETAGSADPSATSPRRGNPYETAYRNDSTSQSFASRTMTDPLAALQMGYRGIDVVA